MAHAKRGKRDTKVKGIVKGCDYCLWLSRISYVDKETRELLAINRRCVNTEYCGAYDNGYPLFALGVGGSTTEFVN